MPDFQLTTPVAFIIFNRPDTAERVFAEIAKAKPPKLLVVGDGARTDREGEAAKVAATRAIIDRVDWPCEVLTNFSEINLGCKRRVSSGLDWVFEQVEEAIILEDDCLPHPTFFRFCEELLVRYRFDQRIAQISGANLQFGFKINVDSYYFSHGSYIWGWATWRNRWKNDYDVNIKKWECFRNEGRVADWFESSEEKIYWGTIFEDVFLGKIDTWDYQWGFAIRANGRLSVIPNVNMISNIGFGSDATHTTMGGDLSDMHLDEMLFPLIHPDTVFASRTLDKRVFDRFSSIKAHQRIIKTILKKLLKVFHI